MSPRINSRQSVGQISAHPSTKVEWTWFVIVLEYKPRCDRDYIGNVETHNAQGEDSPDGLIACEHQEPQKNGKDTAKADCVHRCLRVAVHPVQYR